MSLRIDAVILAGGQARRMGGQDKGLVELMGKPMIEHAINRIRPQVQSILINANRNQERYAQHAQTVFGDDDSGFLGPLAGMVAAMGKTTADLLLVVPCDCPCLPRDLVSRLKAAMDEQGADVAVASDGEYEQPVVMLLKPQLRASMKAFLDAGERKIDFWYAKHKVAVASFADEPNAFVNVNTPEQIAQLTQALSE